jgi:hypothetical protein
MKVALVPRVVVSGLREREYGVLLTDVRALFVLERSDRRLLAMAALILGGAAGILLLTIAGRTSTTDVLVGFGMGAVLAASVANRAIRPHRPDYDAVSPEDLANRAGSISVPYSSMLSLHIERRSGTSPRLSLAYSDPSGARRDFHALVLPDVGWVRSRIDAGAKLPDALGEYAESVHQAFSRALGAGFAGRLGGRP